MELGTGDVLLYYNTILLGKSLKSNTRTGAQNATRAELHGLQSFHLIIRFADRLRIFILMYHIHMYYIIMSYDVFLYHDS